MSIEKHTFRIEGLWAGNSDGDGELHTECNEVWNFGVPEQTGGKPGRSNPEELLLGAVVSCYCITLSIWAEKRRLPLVKMEVDASCDLERQADRSLQIVRIDIKPRLTLTSTDERTAAIAMDTAYKAESHCLISKVLHGNVEIKVEPEIMVPETNN